MNYSFSISTPSPIRNNVIGDRGNNKMALEIGQIISATILERTNSKIHMQTRDNQKIEAPADQVSGEVGDEVFFEVIKSDKNKTMLKQIDNPFKQTLKSVNTKQTVNTTKELFRQSKWQKEDDFFKSDNLEAQLKEMQALARIKRQLLYASNNTSASAVKELLASGVSLQKISINTLTKVMKEIDTRPFKEVTDQELARIIEKTFAADFGQSTKSTSQAIAQTLVDEGLPINSQNIKTLQNVLKRFQEVQNLADGPVAKLLSGTQELTLENIYRSKFTSASPKVTNNESDNFHNVWRQLQSQLGKVFKREGIDNTEANKKAAKFLVENDIAITKTNVDQYHFLKNLQNVSQQDILQKAANNIKQDKPAGQITLVQGFPHTRALFISYEEIITNLRRIHPEHIESLIHASRPITLSSLQDSLTRSLHRGQLTEAGQATLFSSRKQLAEIQIKLTHEAAYRLARKNINISLMPLHQALHSIKGIESDVYASNLRIMGAEANSENISKMSNLYDRISDLKPLDSDVVTDTMKSKESLTIDKMHESAMNAKRADDYEKFATMPKRRHGDSLNKISDQFLGLLRGMGIEPNPENVKAATILSKNNMDVTLDNIDKVKLIDFKINNIYNRLHPNIAASMIKDGLNPSEMHVDNVLEYIDKFDNIYGDNLGEKIAGFIAQMDEQHQLSDGDRNRMVATYRMLNAIQRDDSASIGLTLKHGRDIKLGDMFEDAKYFQRNKRKKVDINIAVNDDFGKLKKVAGRENSVREMLKTELQTAMENIPEDKRRGISKLLDENLMADTASNVEMAQELTEKGSEDLLTPVAYNKALIETIARYASPDALIPMDYEELNNKHIEDLAMELREAQERGATKSDIAQMQKQLQELSEIRPGLIKWLQNNQVTSTFSNAKSLRNLVNDRQYIGKSLTEIRETASTEERAELEEIIMDTDLSLLKEGKTPNTILERIRECLSDISKDNPESMSQVDALRNAVFIKRASLSQRNEYSLPIKLHDRISELNMFVLDENLSSKRDTQMVLSLDTTALGTIRTQINTFGEEVKLIVYSENKESLEYLMKENSLLFDLMKSSGFNITDIQYKLEETRNILADEVGETPNLSMYTSGYDAMC